MTPVELRAVVRGQECALGDGVVRFRQSRGEVGSADCAVDIRFHLYLIRLICAGKEQARAFERQFSGMIVREQRSPDFVISLPASLDARTAHRTTAAPREECELLEVWTSQIRRYPASLPLIPPVAAGPMRNKYLALHGACVAGPAGRGMAILGERGAGKTTIARLCAGDPAISVLAEETVYMEAITKIAHYFLTAVGVRSEDGVKITVPSVDVFDEPKLRVANVERILVLEPGEIDEIRIVLVACPKRLLSTLSRHCRNIGNNQPFDFLAVCDLAASIETEVAHYDPRLHLTQLAELVRQRVAAIN